MVVPTDHYNLGDCIIGEHLIGFARKIFSFKNPKNILKINSCSFKIDDLHGKNAICYVDKKIREAKVSTEKKVEYKDIVKKKIRYIIEEKIMEKISYAFQIYEEIGDRLKGSLMICECSDSEEILSKRIKCYSASHGAMGEIFTGDFAISYVDSEVKSLRAVRLKK